MNNEGYHLD